MPILALQSCLIILTWKFNQETWRCLSKSPLTIGSTTKWLWIEYQEWTILEEETRHFRCTKSVVHAYSYRNAKSRAALHCSGIKNVGGVLYCVIPFKDIVISHIPDKYSKEMSKKSTKVNNLIVLYLGNGHFLWAGGAFEWDGVFCWYPPDIYYLIIHPDLLFCW